MRERIRSVGWISDQLATAILSSCLDRLLPSSEITRLTSRPTLLSIEHSHARLPSEIAACWVPTDEFDDPIARLAHIDGLWIAPVAHVEASPTPSARFNTPASVTSLSSAPEVDSSTYSSSPLETLPGSSMPAQRR